MNTGQNQSLAALRFRLYDRALHPELFEIYHDRHIVQDGYEAQIWVTGCAHAIGFFSEEGCLVQTLAEADAPLPQRGLQLDLPVRGEREHKQTRQRHISYMMNLQVELMSPEVYAKTHDDLERIGGKRGLFASFPMWNCGQLTPFTFIDSEAKPNTLHVFTFQAFPDELTLVKSQTIFELI
ncbi:MAG: DUF2617 family protein [Phycisphaerae bacterium]